jgi:hypothetical protein
VNVLNDTGNAVEVVKSLKVTSSADTTEGINSDTQIIKNRIGSPVAHKNSKPILGGVFLP